MLSDNRFNFKLEGLVRSFKKHLNEVKDAVAK